MTRGHTIEAQALGPVLDRISTGLIVLSPVGEILDLNRSVEWITGASRDEALGKPCSDVLGGVMCGGECSFQETVQTCRSSTSVDLTLPEKGGERRSITKVVTPVRDEAGVLLFFLVVLQDHSAFKDLLKRVRHEDRRFKMILDNLDSGVLTVDRGGHVTFFNAVAEALTGFSRNEILGRPFSALLKKNAERETALLLETVADGKARTGGENELLTREGGPVPVRIRHMALRNEEGRVMGGMTVLTDLSLAYQLDSAIKERFTFYDMVGRSPSMRKIFDILPVISASDATVLIEGPTGTGKDLMARVIHTASPRAAKTLVKVNCAALPDNLLESEMFGYVKGAFTGADRDKPGRFQEADGGTIFLDEIGDMPLALQAKLLRVLEDREFYPLGGRKVVKVDVRIISATNRGLLEMVKEKTFRQDLYYRLNVMRISIPALAERKSDLPLLISHIIKRLALAHKKESLKISGEAMEVLLNHDYPGNVREMENILEHAAIICRGEEIAPRHLPLYLQKDEGRKSEAEPCLPKLLKSMDDHEKKTITEALEKAGGNRGDAARLLGMDRSTLWRKMKKFNMAEK